MQKPQLIDLFRDLASEIAEKDFSFVQEDNAIAELEASAARFAKA